MKTWKIPVEWTMKGVIFVEANTLEAAIDIAVNDSSIPLPDGDYLEGSWTVPDDEDYIRQLLNDDQKDEEVPENA